MGTEHWGGTYFLIDDSTFYLITSPMTNRNTDVSKFAHYTHWSIVWCRVDPCRPDFVYSTNIAKHLQLTISLYLKDTNQAVERALLDIPYFHITIVTLLLGEKWKKVCYSSRKNVFDIWSPQDLNDLLLCTLPRPYHRRVMFYQQPSDKHYTNCSLSHSYTFSRWHRQKKQKVTILAGRKCRLLDV